RNYSGIEPPQWYTRLQKSGAMSDYVSDSVDKMVKGLGELQSVRLFDEDIALWKLAYERERHPDDVDNGQDHHHHHTQLLQEVDHDQAVAPAVSQSQSTSDARSIQTVIRRLGFSGTEHVADDGSGAVA